METKMQFYVIFLLFLSVFSIESECAKNGKVTIGDDKIFYFGYGSNLLMKRMHINNPSAKFFKPAKLENYRLDFVLFVQSWNGAVATIVPEDGKIVWGTLWSLEKDKIPNLDRQEGVHLNWYYPANVTVTLENGSKVTARTYIQTVSPPKLNGNELVPEGRKPSSTYLKVIILGAYESGLPLDYIKSLYEFEDNGKTATPDRIRELGRNFQRESAFLL